MNEKLFDYIAVCPTAFHTCAHSADMLRESGYTELCEGAALGDRFRRQVFCHAKWLFPHRVSRPCRGRSQAL